jgi:ribosomal protein S18 acetylase RimI-like enzyme
MWIKVDRPLQISAHPPSGYFRRMEVVIRRAQADDVPAMLALVRELALFEREPEAVTVTEAQMREAGFGEKPVWLGWVAEWRSGMNADAAPADGPIDRVAEPVIGMAICYERYSTWRGRCLYLEDIVVTEQARGKGVGEKLFKACAAHAVAQGHHHMLWQVLDWNEGAIRFYERFGAEISREWLNGRLYREQLVELVAQES